MCTADYRLPSSVLCIACSRAWQGFLSSLADVAHYDAVACSVVSCSTCKGCCYKSACHYLLGTVQVGEASGLNVQARILLYSLTEEYSIGSAMAALLKGPASQTLLSALEDAVTHYSSTPIAQVRIRCGFLPA